MRYFPALLALVLNAIVAAACQSHDSANDNVRSIPEAIRSNFQLSEFYTKFITVGSLPIVSSDKVADEALLEAHHIVSSMLAKRPDVIEKLAARRIRVAIMSPSEQTTDIPEHRDLSPADYWNRRARGLGATPSRPAISAGAENLLHDADDRYADECILIHEFAHTIHEMALVDLDPSFQTALDDAFANAIKQGLWKNTYAMTDEKEYWAEAVQSFFDANDQDNAQHNDVNTRQELAAYDPAIYAIIDKTFDHVDWKYEGRIGEFLADAGDNRVELVKAWLAMAPERRSGLKFLLENMPEADLRTLTADFLSKHVNLAYEAFQNAPWRNAIPQEVFLNGILPYVNVNESRDAWRDDFRKKFLPIVADCATASQTATKLNQQIFGILDVRYSTERKRADQGPFLSIETHKASCTGLSILLIDACRSVGVPARFVGTPLWSDGSGNHSWVEVWDQGDWHFTGACEPAGDRLDEGWFIGRASTAQIDDPSHAIYAVSYRRTPIHFPLVWDRLNQSVYAVNVTSRYTANRQAIPDGKIQIRIRLVDSISKERIRTKFELLDQNGQMIFEGMSRDDQFDSNDHVEAIVNKDAPLQVRVGDREPIAILPSAAQQLFTLEIPD